VASGEKLSVTQADVPIFGHAIECRINAEDPFMNFMPTPGTISELHFPGGPGIRIDSHAYNGYTIPQYYDSMIAKVIAWGRDRNEAIARMKRALDELYVEGVKTTAPFHQKLMDDPKFRSGRFTTRFLEDFKF